MMNGLAGLKRQLMIALMSGGLLCVASVAGAAELVMFEQDGCYRCDIWKEEVGKIYPLTDEAKVAPLRMVDIFSSMPEDLEFLGRVRFTPYFVVVDDGRKIGQIFGYNDEASFYSMLDEILDKLKQEKTSGNTQLVTPADKS